MSDQPVLLVTGGSRGLGRNAALKLAAKGTGIILTYRNNQQEARAVIDEIAHYGVKATALALNVGDTSSFEHFVEGVQQLLQQTWQRDSFDYLIN